MSVCATVYHNRDSFFSRLAINLPNSYRRRINTMATDTVSQWSPANNVRREQLYISVRDDE